MNKLAGKRLLFVGRLGGLGGAERDLLNFARGLQSSGATLELALVMMPEVSEFFRAFPGKVHLLARGVSFRSRSAGYLRLVGLIRATDAIVCSSEFTPTYITWLLCRVFGKPFLAEVHVALSSAQAGGLGRRLARFVYRRLRFVRCVSKAVAEDLEANFGTPAARITTLHDSFDLQKLASLAAEPVSETVPPFGCPTFVAIGRLTEQKRFDIAVDAFALAGVPEARLLIIGEGPRRGELQSQVEQLGLQTHVRLLGFLTNPYPVLSRATALIVSSDFEGFGRVIVEALALGVPVISTDCPFGPSEILAAGKFGLLVPVGDVAALANAMSRCVWEPGMAEGLAQDGPERAQDFSTEVLARNYHALIERVLNSRG